MKQTRMRAALLLLLGLLLVLPAGCREGEKEPPADEDRTVEQSYGSYTVAAGWQQSKKYSSEDRVFYLQSGHEDDAQPDNFSVEAGPNPYPAAEHERFRMAILSQIANQLDEDDDVELTASGSTTDNGDVLYVFNFVENLPDASQIITRHYYIVGEQRYCLVHLTNFSGDEASDAAAEKLARSFVWAAE